MQTATVFEPQVIDLDTPHASPAPATAPPAFAEYAGNTWWCTLGQDAGRFTLAGIITGPPAAQACQEFTRQRQARQRAPFAQVVQEFLAGEPWKAIQARRAQLAKIRAEAQEHQANVRQGEELAEQELLAGRDPSGGRGTADLHRGEVARLEKWAEDLRAVLAREEEAARRELHGRLLAALCHEREQAGERRTELLAQAAAAVWKLAWAIEVETGMILMQEGPILREFGQLPAE